MPWTVSRVPCRLRQISQQMYLDRLTQHTQRLHLNLPGLPDGSAFQPEPVMDSIERGVTVRRPEPGVSYVAFVDMSGGSNDDAALAIAHRSAAVRPYIEIRTVLPRKPQGRCRGAQRLLRWSSTLSDGRHRAHIVRARF